MIELTRRILGWRPSSWSRPASLVSQPPQELNAAAQFQASQSLLMDRMMAAHRAGLQFDGNRDVYSALGYRRDLHYEDYYSKYVRDSVAGRVIDAPPAATWRNQPEIVDDDDPERTTPFEEAWMNLQKRLRIYHKLERLDRITGIGRYGVLLIGLRNQMLTDQDALPVSGEDDVLFIAPYSECSATIDQYDVDPQSERFGKPWIYSLKTKTEGARTHNPVSLRAHHSRVLHVTENALEDDVFGKPRLRNVFNHLDDLIKVVGGSAETYWLEARRGLHANFDADAKPLSSKEQDALVEQIDEYVNNMRRVIRTQGMDLKSLGGAVANPQGPFDVIIKLVSAATGIPVRILIGSERGELASTQDDGNWASRIEERQLHFAEPMILRPLIDRLIELRALPEPSDGEYEIQWQSLSDPGERERAETVDKIASAAVKFQTAKHIVSPEEARDRLGFEGPAPEVEDDPVDDQEETVDGPNNDDVDEDDEVDEAA